MALLGLVADTHGLFDPLLETLFKDVGMILHAGDVGNPAVLERLTAIAPVRAIKGNIDEKLSTRELPAELTVEAEGRRILLMHDAGKPGAPLPGLARVLARQKPAIVLSGHSHRARLDMVGGLLFANPGGAGKKRFKLERTAGLLHLTAEGARVAIHSLEKPGLPVYLEGEFPLI